MSKRKKKQTEKEPPADALRFYGGRGASTGGSVATDIYMKRIKRSKKALEKMAGLPKVYNERRGHVQPDGSIIWEE